MNCAVYARKSTDQNVADEEKSITRQVARARAYAARFPMFTSLEEHHLSLHSGRPDRCGLWPPASRTGRDSSSASQCMPVRSLRNSLKGGSPSILSMTRADGATRSGGRHPMADCSTGSYPWRSGEVRWCPRGDLTVSALPRWRVCSWRRSSIPSRARRGLIHCAETAAPDGLARDSLSGALLREGRVVKSWEYLGPARSIKAKPDHLAAEELARFAEEIKRQAALDEQARHKLARQKNPKGTTPRRTRRRVWLLPGKLKAGIALVNQLRLTATGTGEAAALQKLDEACHGVLNDWWYAMEERLTPPVSPSPGLTLGQSLVIGALWVFTLNARYPDNPWNLPAAMHLLGMSRSQLAKLTIRGALADLVGMLEKKREWQARVRRCLYLFNKKGAYSRGGCLRYFFDRSQAGKTRGCPGTPHTGRVDEYEAYPFSRRRGV